MKSLLISLATAFLLIATPAHAHKVIASVFASGDSIEGEIGFSNGDPAADTPVEVFDEAGNKLGETKTDGDGFFVYKPTAPVKHIFKANLGAGHVAHAEMAAADIAKILGKATAETASPPPPAQPAGTAAANTSAPTVTVASLTAEEREAIASAVRDETRSLRREIAAYKEKNNLQTVLGGIGYIAGLFGLGFYMAARRKLSAGAA